MPRQDVWTYYQARTVRGYELSVHVIVVFSGLRHFWVTLMSISRRGGIGGSSVLTSVLWL